MGLKFFKGAKFKMERKIFRKSEEASPKWTWDVKPGVVQLGEAWSLQAARGTSGHRHKSGDNYSSRSEDSYSGSDTDSSSCFDSSSVISTDSNVSK